MAQYKNEFVDIDPDTCSMKELEDTIEQMRLLANYYESKQLAIKQFINSVYGATASKYFVGHNTEVAESITLQGQDLNHFSENCVNRYFSGIFQSKEEYNRIIYVPVSEYIEKYSLQNIIEFYKKGDNKQYDLCELPCTKDEIVDITQIPEELKHKLSKVFVKTVFGPYLGITYEQAANIDINKGRITAQKPLDYYAKHAKNPLDSKENPFAYMGKTTYLDGDPTVSMAIAGDTDSLSNDSKVFIDNQLIAIEDVFNKCKYENYDMVLKLENGQEIVPVKNHTTKAYSMNNKNEAIDSPIKYIMRHKVSKGKFKITSKTGKEVIVTEDHSCMVLRNNELISIKAKDININTDKLIEINNI